MSLAAVLILAFSVSLDALAVSVSGGLACRRERTRRNALNAGLFFGGFQFFMPVAGFFGASLAVDLVSSLDHWIAFLLLALVGGNMIREGLTSHPEAVECKLHDFFAPKALVVPAVATSMDALAVGAGIAFAGDGIWFPAAAMGIVTGAVSACGVVFGTRMRHFAGARSLPVAGGLAIILIGLHILLSHLGIC